MDKMTEDEILQFIKGENLVEFVPISFEESERLLAFMKGRYAFLATREGTFKVTEEVFRELVENNFKIKRL